MGRWEYYEALKAFAREVRVKYSVKTDKFGLREIREIYKHEGIKIDLWPYPLKKVRAAYVVDEGKPYVMLNGSIKPIEPRLFSLAHELKHHYFDKDLALRAPISCQSDLAFSKKPMIEIGAEVFAAEFIFPELEFKNWVKQTLPSEPIKAENVVFLKRNCPARISYKFIIKRLKFLKLIRPDQFPDIQFQKLEEELYGVPFYKRTRQ